MKIKWLQIEQISDLTHQILQEYCPDVLTQPSEVPVLSIIEQLCKKWGFAMQSFIGPSIDGLKALGYVDYIKKILLLDRDMLYDADKNHRWIFVAAHELAHLYLHREYFENGNTPYDMEEMEYELFPHNDSLEWQANRFAAELLLPSEMVNLVVVQVSKERGILNNFGKVYLDKQPCNQIFANFMFSKISSIFGVSQTVAKIRLRELNILIEEVSGAEQIADFLRR